jgi:hypothetical protein
MCWDILVSKLRDCGLEDQGLISDKSCTQSTLSSFFRFIEPFVYIKLLPIAIDFLKNASYCKRIGILQRKWSLFTFASLYERSVK